MSLCALGVSCGKKQIGLTLVGSESLNKDDAGAALPVVVRVYQLSGKERLEKADFISLWKSDKEILDADMVDRQEMTLLPDSKIALEIQPKKEAVYLAVMALFLKPQGESWRQIIPVKDAKSKSLELRISDRKIELNELK